MLLNKWIVVAICVVMGALQAWDSGVLRASPGIQALVAAAILSPVVAFVATNSYGVHALAVAVSFVLLTIARVASPVPLPTLHIVAFIPAVVIFFSKAVASRTELRASGGQR